MRFHTGENCTAVSAGEDHLRLSQLYSILVVTSLLPILNSPVSCATYESKPMSGSRVPTRGGGGGWGGVCGGSRFSSCLERFAAVAVGNSSMTSALRLNVLDPKACFFFIPFQSQERRSSADAAARETNLGGVYAPTINIS